jgi:hypothetical protein
MRWPLALTVYFGQHLEPDDLRRLCADYRQEHVRMAAAIEALGPELRRARAGHVLEILRLGVGFHRLVIDWIDTLPWMGEPESTGRVSKPHRKRQRRRDVQRA